MVTWRYDRRTVRPAHPFRFFSEFDPIHVQYAPRACTDMELAAHLNEQTMLLRDAHERVMAGDHQRTIMICDCAHDMPSAPAQRAMQADWLAENEAMLLQVCQATFVVVHGTMLRATITAVMWLARPAHRIRAVPNLDVAVERALALAKQEGLQVPGVLAERQADAVRDLYAAHGIDVQRRSA